MDYNSAIGMGLTIEMARKKTSKRKRKTNRRRKQRSELKSWALLATGLMLGLFVALLVWLQYQTPPRVRTTSPNPIVTPTVTSNKPDSSKPKLENKESKYDFYGSLPTSEVVVPKSTGNNDNAIVVQQAKEFPNDYSSYSIQVGSFSKADGAEEQKARLSILGYEPQIEKNRLHDGKVVHRVILGPYPDLESANRTRTKLHSQKIDNSLLKIE